MHKIKRQTKAWPVKIQNKGELSMAIISSGVETEMVVRYQIGMVNGSPVFRQKSFSGLKMDVSDEDLHLPLRCRHRGKI
ncbi:DUF1659 domain-containing protein [Desulfosporosinus sp. OT]|uniref:DUF1659 domain-containing protein n=1 Tax=Desulfosporosinus sp. OT TaxID=913865 RepID=UPI000223B18E|nr:hypothetical protein DOT_0393 [Desulfosporosinus sp. OT]